MAADLSGQSWAVLAMSEMGKGVWFKQWLRKQRPPRLLIWDRNDEYGAHARQCMSLEEMATASRASRFALRYVPVSAEKKPLVREFEGFCMLAMKRPGSTVAVEELADVTTATHAPPAWGELNRRGRHHCGLHIIGFSQAPAWIDKSFLANATFLHVGYLGFEAHRKAAAAEMNIRPDEIDALVQFEYLEYRKATKELTRGRVRLPPRRG
jgi:hypothetical protein